MDSIVVVDDDNIVVIDMEQVVGWIIDQLG